MQKALENYAFIDGQNFYKSIKGIGKDLNYSHFRTYLTEKHAVKVAYYFIGYIKKYEYVYNSLRRQGFEPVFKEVSLQGDKYKGNIDVNLTLRAVTELNKYKKAVIITSDGDYASLVEYLDEQGKLECLIACSRAGCSYLLRKLHQKIKIYYLDDIIRDLQKRKETS
jgi:uncharacterized LabA/DUF88 family protein